MGWYAVFYREMVVLWKKIGRMGYVFSTIISPFIYLFSFGLGLGGRVSVTGGYLPFLTSGIIGVTIMMNSFQQTASSISVGRYYYHNFQNLVLSPINTVQVIGGIVLAGILRGLLFGGLVFAVAGLCFQVSWLGWPALVGAVSGALCFSAMGVVVGMLVKQPDDVSLVNNFFITPMAFFGGSFFPLQNLPAWLGNLISLFPIGGINFLLRSPEWSKTGGLTLIGLWGLTLVFFSWGSWLYSRYSE